MAKLRRLIIVLLLTLLVFHICLMFYRKFVLEFTENIRRESDQNFVSEDDTDRQKIVNDFDNSGKANALKVESSNGSVKVKLLKGDSEKKEAHDVISTASERLLQAIREWRKHEAERDGEPIRYDAHDLLVDPKPDFNPNFKNPCWYEGQKLRCLPYAFVIGVKKCGTSDLFFRLSLHPDFIKPGFKEAQWFARKRFKPGGELDDINYYIDMFSKAAVQIQKSSNTTANGKLTNLRHITGEGSPSNLHLNSHWRYLPGNEHLQEPEYVILDYIHHFIPNAKIIITFRDPIERLYSDYYHEYGSLMGKNHPNPTQFHEVVKEGVALYKECFKSRPVRSCVYEPDLYDKTKIQIQLGIYYVFWADLTRVFPREQILVLQNKDLRDKYNSMKTVYAFLGLRPLNDNEMLNVVNAKERYSRKASYAKEGPMLNETFQILKDFYSPFNKIMADLTGDDNFLYQNSNKS